MQIMQNFNTLETIGGFVLLGYLKGVNARCKKKRLALKVYMINDCLYNIEITKL